MIFLLTNVIFLIGVIGRPNISSETNRNYPDCIILENWIFEVIILADEPFAKAFHIIGTCVWVNNNLFDHWNLQPNLMKDLKLLQFHFL